MFNIVNVCIILQTMWRQFVYFVVNDLHNLIWLSFILFFLQKLPEGNGLKKIK